MLLPQLIQAIETHAAALTEELMVSVRANPRLKYLHAVDDDDLRRRALDLFTHVGRWLEAGRTGEVERAYVELGRKRAEQGVPASELIAALIVVKERLWDFVKRNNAPGSALEMFQEDELLALVSRFFDQATYHSVRGYEAAERELRGERAWVGT